MIDYSDTLIDELKRADVVVLGLPMYNFGLPSALKAYFAHPADPFGLADGSISLQVPAGWSAASITPMQRTCAPPRRA